MYRSQRHTVDKSGESPGDGISSCVCVDNMIHNTDSHVACEEEFSTKNDNATHAPKGAAC